MGEESWKMNHGGRTREGEIMEEESWKENLGGIMEEESWRRNHEGGIMEAWERNGIMEEASLRRNLEVSGGIWRSPEASGSSGGIWELRSHFK